MRKPTRACCIGVASTHKAMMVQIDTTEQVITEAFKAGSTFTCIEVDTLNKQPLRKVSLPIKFNKTLHFVVSNEMSGWYFIVMAAGCSCKRPHCSHLETLRRHLVQVVTA